MKKFWVVVLTFVAGVSSSIAADRGLEIATEKLEVAVTSSSSMQPTSPGGWASASILADRGAAPSIALGSGHFYLEAAGRGSTDREHLGIGWVALLPNPSTTGFLWLSLAQEKSGRESGSRIGGGWGIVKPVTSDLGFVVQLGIVRHNAEGRTLPAAQIGLMTTF